MSDRVWVYVRSYLSEDMAERQLSEVLAWAEKEGCEIVGQSVDVTRRFSLRRRGFQEAMTAVKTGQADAILTERLENIHDRDQKLYRFFFQLQRYHAKLMTNDRPLGVRLLGTALAARVQKRARKKGLPLPW